MHVNQSKSRPASGGNVPPSRRPSQKASANTSVFSRLSSRRNSSRNPSLGLSPYGANGTPVVSRARRGGKTTNSSTATTPKSSVSRAGGVPLNPQRGRANERIRLESISRERAAEVRPRRRYVVGVMSHCGSIYEELARQLVATGRWSAVTLKQRAGVKTLYVAETHQDISDVNVHLLLGDKLSCERVIAARRALHNRIHHGPSKGSRLFTPGPRVPMGNGDDGERRIVDFVENTRCITLKSTMVSTLLRYHRRDWGELGSYLPMTFKIHPSKPADDERVRLLDVARKSTPETAPMWIAKSSSGCHGDDIEIFSGDRKGVQRLLAYIDNHSRGHAWVAQQYIDRPLLYHKRKFDIRCMALFIRDTDEVFVHEDLVMRMSSVVYDRTSATGKCRTSKLAHITNHCIQETGHLYSAFEEGNELWKEHLDGLIRYKGDRLPLVRRRELLKATPAAQNSPGRRVVTTTLNNSGVNTSDNTTHPGQSPYMIDLGSCDGTSGGEAATARGTISGITLRSAIMPQIYEIVRDTVLASKPHLPVEPRPSPTHCFQVLGYDFLIDETLKVWLLEINGAPGGPTRLVPKIMADTIELAIDPYLPTLPDTKAKGRNGYTRVHPV